MAGTSEIRSQPEVGPAYDYASYEVELLRACVDGVLYQVGLQLLNDPDAKAAALNALGPASP